MAKEYLTDADVELEIERLQESEAVKLAMKEKQYKYKRRQCMYTLRWYEKRGKALMAQGMTLEAYDFDFDEKGGDERNVRKEEDPLSCGS